MSYLSHLGANVPGSEIQGAKVPGSESTRERKFQGTKVPGSESSRKRKFHVTFAPESESSRERKFQGAKVPPMVLSLLGAKVRGNESSIIPPSLQVLLHQGMNSDHTVITIILN